MINKNIPAQKNKELEKNKEKADFILKNLGFENFDELRNKKILDIGSLDAIFALYTKSQGIEIVCTDINETCQKEGGRKGLNYVLANAKNLPFEDNDFDLILSHASAPNILTTKEDVIAVLKEIKRVLKPGGEFRFGPIYLNANIFSNEELFTAKEEKIFNLKQRIERVRQHSIGFLKSFDKNIFETFTNHKKIVPNLYYTMKK